MKAETHQGSRRNRLGDELGDEVAGDLRYGPLPGSHRTKTGAPFILGPDRAWRSEGA